MSRAQMMVLACDPRLAGLDTFLVLCTDGLIRRELWSLVLSWLVYALLYGWLVAPATDGHCDPRRGAKRWMVCVCGGGHGLSPWLGCRIVVDEGCKVGLLHE